MLAVEEIEATLIFLSPKLQTCTYKHFFPHCAFPTLEKESLLLSNAMCELDPLDPITSLVLPSFRNPLFPKALSHATLLFIDM